MGKPERYDADVQWTVRQDDRKRHPRYVHSCHQCGPVVVTFSSQAVPAEVRRHETHHRMMHAIDEAIAEDEA